MSAPSRLACELAAEGLRSQLGITTYDADPFAALRHLRVRVLRYPLKIEGAYVQEEGDAFAAINSLTDVTRQRFTAAHELGHHVLHDETEPTKVVDVSLGDDPEDPTEIAADAFAVAFLMPETHVREVAASAADGVAIIVRTMWQFDVSKPAAARRCLELGLVSEAEAERFMRDRRRVALLFDDAGLDPRLERNKGQREIDPEHVARVHRLVAEDVVHDSRVLLVV